MSANKTLGETSLPKLLFKFSMPCIIGLLIGAIYNIIDQIFIGNSSLGYLGNAATGISFPVICIANAIAWSIGDAAAAYVSICSGMNDSEHAHKCVGTGLTISFILSIILTFISIAFCEPLMTAFGASGKTLNLACDYFKIIAFFFPVYLLLNIFSSVLRGDGSPSHSMVGLLVGAIINIILDPIFIFALDWGIKGAAYATVIGQVITLIIFVHYFRHTRTFKLHLSSLKVDFSMVKRIIQLGGSTFIIQISMVVMTLLCNITLAKYGGLSKYGSDIPLSVFSIQTKVYTIINNIVVGIALGGQPILGYNLGAGRLDRVRKLYFYILGASMVVGVGATLAFELCPQLLIGMFGSGSDLYMEFAVKSFRIFLGLSFITCFIKMSSIFFQALGESLCAMIASVIRDLFCFTVFTISFCHIFEKLEPGHGIYGILFASPMSDLIAGSVILVLTVRFLRKLGRKNQQKEGN